MDVLKPRASWFALNSVIQRLMPSLHAPKGAVPRNCRSVQVRSIPHRHAMTRVFRHQDALKSNAAVTGEFSPFAVVALALGIVQ
jgi:hypothetical protein